MVTYCRTLYSLVSVLKKEVEDEKSQIELADKIGDRVQRIYSAGRLAGLETSLSEIEYHFRA